MAGQAAEGDRFQAAVAGLRRGDFSASAPLFAQRAPSEPCRIIQWVKDGRFREAPDALREAFTCACFHVAIIEALLRAGARTAAVEHPTGVESIDRLLERRGAQPGTQGVVPG